MKFIKTFEALTQKEKEEFTKMNAEPFTTFNLEKLSADCRKYDIIFINLLKEMMLNKKITFYCNWCYTEDLTDFSYDSEQDWNFAHNTIGTCVDIRHESDEGDWDSDIVVRINDDKKWHTLFTLNSKKPKRVRIYNYSEGQLAQELEMLKNAEKYNI